SHAYAYMPLHDALPVGASGETATPATPVIGTERPPKNWPMGIRMRQASGAATPSQSTQRTCFPGDSVIHVRLLDSSTPKACDMRSEEHTSELQSRENLV